MASRTCAAVLAEHMRGSRFTTAALETDFGVEDGMARLTVNAMSGECTLEGRIDRIDEWAEGGYLRVIDYKRGGRALALDEVYHGLSLQLPVYLAASMKKRREGSAGVYYFNLGEGVLATQDNWYQVYVPSKGVTAWISKTYASLGLAAKTTGDVNLRSGPGKENSRIDVIKKGAKITVLSVGSGWSQISWNGQTGYISNKYWAYR